MLSGCGTQSDAKQKRDEALPLSKSVTPEAHLSLVNEQFTTPIARRTFLAMAEDGQFETVLTDCFPYIKSR